MAEIIALNARRPLPMAIDARLAVALAVHDAIVARIGTDRAELKDIPDALAQRFGGEGSLLAEACFLRAYACDPYVFAARLIGLRDDAN